MVTRKVAHALTLYSQLLAYKKIMNVCNKLENTIAEETMGMTSREFTSYLNGCNGIEKILQEFGGGK